MPNITNNAALQAAMYFDLINVKVPTPQLMSKGVYKITNTGNGKFYIGATSDCFLHRWKQHQCGLRNFEKKDFVAMTNVPLMQDFLKFGKNFFWLRFEILADMPGANARQIFELEKKMINILNPHYNIIKL